MIPKLIYNAVGMIFIFELIKVIPPYIFKRVIDTFVTYDPVVGISLHMLAWLLGGYFGSMLLMTCCEMTSRRFLYMQIHRTEPDIGNRAVRKLLNLDVSYHERNNTGANMSKVFRGMQRVNEIMFQLVDVIIPIFFQSITTLIILFFISWEAAVAYIVFVPLFVFILLKESMYTQKYREKIHESHDRFAAIVAQSIINVRTVKDFNNEDREMQKSALPLREYNKALNMRNLIGVWNLGLEDFLINLARVLTLGFGVWLMIHGRITAGSLVFMVTLTEKAYINLQRVYRIYYVLQDAAPSVARFVAIRDEPVIVVDNPSSRLKMQHGSVCFKDVTFAYNKKSIALHNVSFDIKPKSVVALVGRSGCGKSTTVKLILRHFDPTYGCVLIDGRNVREYSLRNLRSSIGIVSQDVELFNESVADNIAYGTPGVLKSEVVHAAKLANAHDFIRKLEHGYDTLIGERGVRLSGGEKQRLAIARALIKKPKIIIFDEATSSLDAESERYVHNSIKNLIGKVTLIIIAHRFATIQKVDKIILLENGYVAEIGTHNELLTKKGIFAKLRKLQQLGDLT